LQKINEALLVFWLCFPPACVYFISLIYFGVGQKAGECVGVGGLGMGVSLGNRTKAKAKLAKNGKATLMTTARVIKYKIRK